MRTRSIKRCRFGPIAVLLTVLLVAGFGATPGVLAAPTNPPSSTSSAYLPLVQRDLIQNQPPWLPHAPSPLDGATGEADALTLRWSGGDPDGDAVTYFVYLEVGNAKPTRLRGQTATTALSVEGLERDATYFWQVAAVDVHGARTVGPVWSFTTAGETLASFAADVVALTNAHRTTAGCPALEVSPLLTQAAQRHSEDMARNSFMSHTGSDGSTLRSRVDDTGYLWMRLAENIAAGYPTPASVVSAWMNSEGHRNNILNCSLTEIGVAHTYRADDPLYKHYWTQKFATPRP